ncbi:DUF6241 domain-containing protein [Guptibacillus hwajinpoensis]|uniref:DUF6241 domain-containing protein n=1 Tax=Guptibacillus hwajinpoensis TaxID=208199 RepID=UPI001CD766A9|nr:DUF6241 domain-containing protein [Pseudalkalibacillus hwajinpoensis]MCA0991461.1 DUF6241 domain-containing protein [Pseudalkalibacillus hwajinpoensis]
MPSTKTILISIISIVFLTLGLGYWFISDMNTSLLEEKEVSEASDEGAAEASEGIDQERYIDEGSNSTANEDIPSEQHFMNTLHGMTHQKVYAEEKWTLVEMTDARIADMLAILDQVEGTGEYEHYDLYEQALMKWKNGNFENAVYVHNELWSLKNGSIGKASRLLSADEERAFIEEHY